MFDYSKHNFDGEYDESTFHFTTVEGMEFGSFGGVSYGNNNDFEVMLPVDRTTKWDDPFVCDQFPVFLANHEDGMESLGTPLPEFIRTAPPEHLNEIIAQLGAILHDYIGLEERFYFTVSHEFSLDQLKTDLESLYSDPSTRVYFEPKGPAGGNTEVRVSTQSKSDLESFKNYAVAQGLTLLKY